MATFPNNKKKDWFSHETGLFFVHGEVFKDGSRNSATFKMELFATIGDGRKLQRASSDVFTTNGHYLHVVAVTRPSFQAKLKSEENNHALKVASDTFSRFGDVFYFLENADFCVINILLQFENQLRK